MEKIVSYLPGGNYKKYKNTKTVLVGGCFDVLHYGHILFLKTAKTYGDFLIIALEPDEKIIRYKNRSPVHHQLQRAEILSALSFVDLVLLLPELNNFECYGQLVHDIKPDILAVTEGDPQICNKQLHAEKEGAELKIVVKRLDKFSSAAIIDNNI